MNLYTHQQKYADNYKDSELVVWEGGCGKTVAAAVWLKDDRDDDAIVVCPKRVKEKWVVELDKWDTKATVLTKEEFKKTPHKKWSAIVIDECHNHAAPLFIAKSRSKLAEHTYELIRHNKETPLLLLTATPISSAPHNLHTLLMYMQVAPPWNKWRDRFYDLTRRPYLSGMAWLPKPNWRKEIATVLKRHADIVTLSDIFTDLPEQETIIVKTKAPKFTPQEWEPSKRFHEECRNEQKPKVKAVLDIAKDYRQVLVSAHYVEQCETLAKELSKHRPTYLVTGKVKDQESIVVQAKTEEECFLVFQGSLGEGWEFPSASCLIFASMPFGVKSYVQSKYRIRRIHDLHPVFYYHILGGRCDISVYKSVMAGKDFVPSEYESTTTA